MREHYPSKPIRRRRAEGRSRRRDVCLPRRLATCCVLRVHARWRPAQRHLEGGQIAAGARTRFWRKEEEQGRRRKRQRCAVCTQRARRSRPCCSPKSPSVMRISICFMIMERCTLWWLNGGHSDKGRCITENRITIIIIIIIIIIVILLSIISYKVNKNVCPWWEFWHLYFKSFYIYISRDLLT